MKKRSEKYNLEENEISENISKIRNEQVRMAFLGKYAEDVFLQVLKYLDNW